jgi:two-component sensor histidine kinase
VIEPATTADAALRQLRHQTKNALQRIMCSIEQARELQETPRGQRLVSELENRVRLTSAVSDALFGLTVAPGPLPERLRMLVESTVELLADPDQILRLEVSAEPGIPAAMHETVLRIAHEFVGNAVKHGMVARMIGRIEVSVRRAGRGGARLAVTDDGWGPCCAGREREGLRLARLLAGGHRGTASLTRRDGLTVAEAVLHPR